MLGVQPALLSAASREPVAYSTHKGVMVAPRVQRFASLSRDISEQIVALGGVLTLPGAPQTQHLVGELRWVSENRIMVFPAFGDHPSDAVAVTFDGAEVQPVGLCFQQGNQVRAFLATIDKAAVDDPDDYRVAWSLWQEIHPLRRSLIDEAYVQLGGTPPPFASLTLTAATVSRRERDLAAPR